MKKIAYEFDIPLGILSKDYSTPLFKRLLIRAKRVSWKKVADVVLAVVALVLPFAVVFVFGWFVGVHTAFGFLD